MTRHLFIFLPSSSLSDWNPELVIAVPRKVLEGVNNHLEVLLTAWDQFCGPETPTESHIVGEHLLVLETHNGVLVIIEMSGAKGLETRHHHVLSSEYPRLTPVKNKACGVDLGIIAQFTTTTKLLNLFLPRHIRNIVSAPRH